MSKILRQIVKQFRRRDFFFFVAIQYAIIQFLVSLDRAALVTVFTNFFSCSGLLFVTSGILFMVWAWLVFSFKEKDCASDYAFISLAPLLFLLFWNSHNGGISIVIALTIVSITVLCLFMFLANEERILVAIQRHHTTFIAIFTATYCVVLSFLIIRQYNNFSVFNPEDFANYNQMFWNTIRGNIFKMSLYGNNFAGHNSPVYFLLVPFYCALPHPLTLMIVKTVLLSLCILPFYCIAKHILPKQPLFLLLFAFLFYPYFISQHFVPPHEICFIPFFLLWAYYFFMKKRFASFMIFLMLSLSTKEHIALIAVMFGVYALCAKRSPRWIVVPIVVGVSWGIVSLLIIHHFQKIYHFYDPWLLSSLKQKFLSQRGGPIINIIVKGLSSSNITNIYSLKLASPLLSAIGILPPLLSPVGVLGLPEFILNLIADRPDVLAPARHYNIVVSCFLLIATLGGIKRILYFRWIRNQGLHPETPIIVLSILMLSLTLMHSHTWVWMAACPRSKTYVAMINEALTHIPLNAYVGVPKNVAVHVSSRPNYFFLGQTQYIKDQQRQNPEFILTDENQTPYLMPYDLNHNYELIFNKEKIRVFKKVGNS